MLPEWPARPFLDKVYSTTGATPHLPGSKMLPEPRCQRAAALLSAADGFQQTGMTCRKPQKNVTTVQHVLRKK